jgi:hypothetical protein
MQHVSLELFDYGEVRGPTGETEGRNLHLWVHLFLEEPDYRSDEYIASSLGPRPTDQFESYKQLYKAWPSGRYNGLKITGFQPRGEEFDG